MYREQCCAAIKVNGQVVRELNPGEVILKFGSEYSIYFKNMSTRKASLKIEIDGSDVLDNNSLIVTPNSYVDLERFYSTNNKFKFIKMSDKIASHRGVKAEDGIVRLEWQFEKEYVGYYSQPFIGTNPYGYDGRLINHSMQWSDSTLIKNCACASIASPVSQAKVATFGSGITGKGSESDQSFNKAFIGQLDLKKFSICFNLKGTDKDSVFVKTKIKCDLCGTLNNYKSKFCSECGNAVSAWQNM